jgi:hypothetical protein
LRAVSDLRTVNEKFERFAYRRPMYIYMEIPSTCNIVNVGRYVVDWSTIVSDGKPM